MSRPVLAGLALSIALVAVGCGSDKKSSSSSAPPPAAAPPSTASSGGSAGAGAVTVDETEYKLNPAQGTVKASGGKVTISVKNSGKIPHALSIEKGAPGGKDLESKTIAGGQSATLSAKLKPGKYEWYCPIDGHKGLGMKGELVVQ